MLGLDAMLTVLDPLPPRVPLCERLTTHGAEHLSIAELTALVLSSSVTDGQLLLDLLGGARGLARAGLADLSGLGHLSLQRACRLKAALELGRRVLDEPLERGDLLSHPDHVLQRMRARLQPLEHEELHVLGLDNQNRLVKHFVAAVGSNNIVFLLPADVFRPLIRDGAQRFILVHNHPSGEIDPSVADRQLTARFAVVGLELGIPIVDHVIVGRRGRFSFAEQRLLENPSRT